jgi:hyperosmotically inducible periplasmic protein
MKTRYLIILTLILSLIGGAATADEKETEQNSDIWLKAKIVTTYALSEHLNPFTIDVNVTSGVVTLTGTVESDIESDLAAEIAKGVKGVKEVNNKLNISPEAQRDTERSSFLHYVEDANITARVKSRLLLDSNTHGLKMHVTTKNGVVFLEGKVDSEIEADLARQIVRNTKGVIDIEDNLTIMKKQSANE